MSYIKYQLSFSCYFSNWRHINFALYRDTDASSVVCRQVKIYDVNGDLLTSIPSKHKDTLDNLVRDYASAWCEHTYGDTINERL